ncbi:phosphoribosylformylglycinamidine cyclo-ligase [Christensenellaceae bacterium OttesenSCG-928-L17]|nr:phosphoribosylformylglycinamidine cyclo-ligase [Christensenellaceae bacterium OttesenSCG-928-L17]
MNNSYSESYQAAGVDITAGYESVERMKKHIARTNIPGVLSSVGGFGGMFLPDLSGMREPVLVSGTDGVGTKLKLAFLSDRHDTVGIDCVAMCVNDIVCAGAKPLFFLDYIATGKNNPAQIEAIVSGVAEGCVQAGCALIGGETAEMPGFYPENEYDLAGFAVGMVERARMLSSTNVRAGDVLLALPSSGPHSNGFSLIRKVFRTDEGAGALEKHHAELGGTLFEALLAPTTIYVQPVLALLAQVDVKSVAHITGGGFYENIPRCLNEKAEAVIFKKSLQTPPVFDMIQRAGNIPARDMFNTFNMGVGMCAVVSSTEADAALRCLQAHGVNAYVMGEIIAGERGVALCE